MGASVRRGGHDGWGLRGSGTRRQGGHDGMGTARPAQVRCLTGRAADALGGAGANGRPGRGGCRCAARVGVAAVPGAGVRGAAGPVGFGVERDLVGLGGGIGRVRPRRALCAACGVSRVLLPDSMLRRRQYGVEVIWAALLAAARGRPWNQVAAGWGCRIRRCGSGCAGSPGGRTGCTRGCAGCCPGWSMTRCCRRGPRARPVMSWRCWGRCISRCPAGGRWWPGCRRGSWRPGCRGAGCWPRAGRRG